MAHVRAEQLQRFRSIEDLDGSRARFSTKTLLEDQHLGSTKASRNGLVFSVIVIAGGRV